MLQAGGEPTGPCGLDGLTEPPASPVINNYLLLLFGWYPVRMMECSRSPQPKIEARAIARATSWGGYRCSRKVMLLAESNGQRTSAYKIY